MRRLERHRVAQRGTVTSAAPHHSATGAVTPRGHPPSLPPPSPPSLSCHPPNPGCMLGGDTCSGVGRGAGGQGGDRLRYTPQ